MYIYVSSPLGSILRVQLAGSGKRERGGGGRDGELVRITSWMFENISFLHSLPVSVGTVSSVLVSLSFDG